LFAATVLSAEIKVMAADYYNSSQMYKPILLVGDCETDMCRLHWRLTRSQLEQNHKPDLEVLAPKQYQLVRIYLYHRINTCVSGTLLKASCTCSWTQAILSTTGYCNYLRVPLPILLQVRALLALISLPEPVSKRRIRISSSPHVSTSRAKWRNVPVTSAL
jgi:hypothetical protein